MKKYISWNVNGIRAAAGKGFLEYLKRESPDIIGLQEVKAIEEQNPIPLELQSLGYEIYWNSAERKGYSGTAIFSRHTPMSVSHGIGILEHDNEGRVLTLEFSNHYFITVYTPNSKDDLSRLVYRQDWDKAFLSYVETLEQNKPVIFCGDLNVAHNEIDLANPRANRGEHGFTDEERDGFRNMLSGGYFDSFRSFYPDTVGAYTWWSNFARSRERNVGWRIDYFMVSESLRRNLSGAFIRQEILGSDHCPIGIEIDI